MVSWAKPGIEAGLMRSVTVSLLPGVIVSSSTRGKRATTAPGSLFSWMKSVGGVAGGVGGSFTSLSVRVSVVVQCSGGTPSSVPRTPSTYVGRAS